MHIAKWIPMEGKQPLKCSLGCRIGEKMDSRDDMPSYRRKTNEPTFTQSHFQIVKDHSGYLGGGTTTNINYKI